MKADITKKTFQKRAHYRKVNMQQGRVQTDADWNEQLDIQTHHDETFLIDLVGRTGAPNESPGFEITPNNSGYLISKGRYYVDGILCENEEEEDVGATDQPDIKLVYFDWDGVNAVGTDTKRFIDFLKTSLILTKKQPQRIKKLVSSLDWLDWEKIRIESDEKKNEIKIISKSNDRDYIIITLDKPRSEATKAIMVIGPENRLAYSFVVKSNDDGKNVKFGYTPALPRGDGNYLAYLDIWERHLTHLDDPKIREVALGGADTATRTKIVWQVKLLQVGVNSDSAKFSCQSQFPEWNQPTGKLQARAEPIQSSIEPCELPPRAGYRRLENQLYRIEIHDGGDAESNTVTFKWSRDNGTVATRVTDINYNESKMTVSDVGRDTLLGFSGNNVWVEVTDDYHELAGLPGTMVQLKNVTNNFLNFYPNTVAGDPLTNEAYPQEYHPKVRRWDTDSDTRASPALTDVSVDKYIDLEDRLQVKFSKGTYKSGSYWLAPARTATADIEWPKNGADPVALEPDGDQHHYAPLMLLSYKKGILTVLNDCRALFLPSTSPTLNYVSGDGQEGTSGTTLPIELKVLVTKGEKPVKGAAIKFKVTFGNGVVDPGDQVSDEHGFARCEWTLGDLEVQQAEATLFDSRGNPSNIPIYFNASVSTQSADLSAKSGLIDLKLDPRLPDQIYGPFEHFLSGMKIPPAIMLGLVSTSKAPGDDIDVKFTEDYTFNHSDDKTLRFKPIDIDLKKFNIQFDLKEVTPEVPPVILRFWAIPAEEVSILQSYPQSMHKAPVVEDKHLSAKKNEPKDIRLEATDLEGERLEFQKVADPKHGNVDFSEEK